MLDAPALTVPGMQLRLLTVRTGSIMMFEVRLTPPALALMVAVVGVATVPAVDVNTVLVDPSTTVRGAGAGSAPLLDVSNTTMPPDGAGFVRVAVQLTVSAGFTVGGEHASVASAAGATTLRVALRQPEFSVAVMVAVASEATEPALTLKVFEVAPAEIAMIAGTVTGPVAVTATVAPPAGAAAESVTVQVAVPDAFTVDGSQLSPVTVVNGATVMLPVRTTLPAVAVSVTAVEAATLAAVALNAVVVAP
jgi:hypothetical protein